MSGGYRRRANYDLCSTVRLSTTSAQYTDYGPQDSLQRTLRTTNAAAEQLLASDQDVYSTLDADDNIFTLPVGVPDGKQILVYNQTTGPRPFHVAAPGGAVIVTPQSPGLQVPAITINGVCGRFTYSGDGVWFETGRCPVNAILVTFRTSWNQSPGNDVLTLPLGGTYSVSVDFGEGGGFEAATSSPPTHTYAAAITTRTVRVIIVSGSPSFNMGSNPSPARTMTLRSIEEWGGITLTGAGEWFRNTPTLLAINAEDAPVLSGVTFMQFAFSGCTSLATINQTGLDAWVVPSGKLCTGLFSLCPLTGITFGTNWFNSPTGCSEMFGNYYGASASNVAFSPSIIIPSGVSVDAMFSLCYAFNNTPPELAPGPRASLGNVFANASSFTGPLPASWLTAASATSQFYFTFAGASVFNQNLGATFVTSSASNLAGMLEGATSFTNGGSNSIESWDTSNVYNFNRMMDNGCPLNYNILGAGKWSLVSASDMSDMFRSTVFNNGGAPIVLDLGTTNRGISLDRLFQNCTALTDTAAFGGSFSYPTGGGTVISMREMYNACPLLTGSTVPATLVTNKAVNLVGMFWQCTSFVGSAAMCSWDTSSVVEFCAPPSGPGPGTRGTFQDTLFDQPVLQAAAPHWDFTSAIRTSKMFPPAFTNGGQQVVFKPLTNTGPLDCRDMFSGTGCTSFDIDFDTTGAVGDIQAEGFFPGTWNSSLAGCHIKRIVAPGFRYYSASWSQANFNATIEAWGVTFSADAPSSWIVNVSGSAITLAGTTGAALAGYTFLTGTKGWTFIGTGF